MTVDAVGFTLGLLVIGMSLVAIRGRHLLLSISTAGLWAGFLAFILANTAALSADNRTILIVSCIGFMIALFLLGAFRDIRTEGNKSNIPPQVHRLDTGSPMRKFVSKLNSDDVPNVPKSQSSETAEEYRDRVHRALRRRRRR